jgi:two-component system OmpR family response regulator
MNYLLVEDDPDVVESVRASLHARSADVDVVTDGIAALERIRAVHYDAIIVDRMLPSLSGLELVRRMRQQGDLTPVLMLTALGGLDDRVTGLEAGADDYLVKPFEHPELIARLNALVRRSQNENAPTTIQIADLRLDFFKRTATRGDQEIELQAKEFQLLATLALHAGKTLTRTMLLERVWGFHFEPHTSVVETHISRLRSKVDRPFQVQLIHTIRGLGYCLHASPDDWE